MFSPVSNSCCKLLYIYLLPFSLKVKPLGLVIIYYLFLDVINAQLIFMAYLLVLKIPRSFWGGGKKGEEWGKQYCLFYKT